MQRAGSAASVSSADGAALPRCRLCWDGEAAGDPLVSPCRCRGSVGYIHMHCLQRWLEVKREQGATRSRTARCEVCRAKYDTSKLPTGPGSAPLLPHAWSDPLAIAAVLHGAMRAYVVFTGLSSAYGIYRSINEGLPPVQAAPSATITGGVGGGGSGSAALGSAAAAAAGVGRGRGWGGGGRVRTGVAAPPPGAAQQQQPQQQQQPLRHHLSLSVPVAGAGMGGGLGSSSGSAAGSKAVLATLRQRFEKATMVQVYWYSALMAMPMDALFPQPDGGIGLAAAANAGAFAGMAVGATVGGMVAQLVFLPMLGSGRLAALGCSCQLLVKCVLRLLAAEACQPAGYRVLVGLVRGVMARVQALRRWRRRRRQQRVAERQRLQQEVGEEQEQGLVVAPEAAA